MNYVSRFKIVEGKLSVLKGIIAGIDNEEYKTLRQKMGFDAINEIVVNLVEINKELKECNLKK